MSRAMLLPALIFVFGITASETPLTSRLRLEKCAGDYGTPGARHLMDESKKTADLTDLLNIDEAERTKMQLTQDGFYLAGSSQHILLIKVFFNREEIGRIQIVENGFQQFNF